MFLSTVCAVWSEHCIVSLILPSACTVSFITQTFLHAGEWLSQISASLVGILSFLLLWSPCFLAFIWMAASSQGASPALSLSFSLVHNRSSAMFSRIRDPKVMGTNSEGLRPRTPQGKVSLSFYVIYAGRFVSALESGLSIFLWQENAGLEGVLDTIGIWAPLMALGCGRHHELVTKR